MKQLKFPELSQLLEIAEGVRNSGGYEVPVLVAENLFIVFTVDYHFGCDMELRLSWGTNELGIAVHWIDDLDEIQYEKAKKELQKSYEDFVASIT